MIRKPVALQHMRRMMPALLAAMCLAAGCDRNTSATNPAGVASNGIPQFVFGESNKESLKEGQVLSGVVNIAVKPFCRGRHGIDLQVDGELANCKDVPEWSTDLVVFRLDTRQLASGEHLLGISGAEMLDGTEFKVRVGELLGKDVGVFPLKQIKVCIQNPSPQPRLKNP